MKYSIVIPDPILKNCGLHLLKEYNRENMVICLAGIKKSNRETTFLIQNFQAVPHEAFDIHSKVFLKVKKRYYKQRVLEAYNSNLHLIVWHSHPFCNIAHFSQTDLENDKEQGEYLKKKIPHLFFVALVSGRENTLGRVYTNNGLQFIDNITIISKQGIKTITRESKCKKDFKETALLLAKKGKRFFKKQQ